MLRKFAGVLFAVALLSLNVNGGTEPCGVNEYFSHD
jgi:hypothetical protein